MLNEKELKECKEALATLQKHATKIEAVGQIEKDKNNPCCNGIDSGLEKIADGVKEVVDGVKSIWNKFKGIF